MDTLTVDSALDVYPATETVDPVRHMRHGSSCVDPGGGGVNGKRVI